VAACESVDFRLEQTVVSTAAGVTLAALKPAVSPATIVRAMPITCAAICRSPTLLHPENPQARSLFDLLGTVHVLSDESLKAWTEAMDVVLERLRGLSGVLPPIDRQRCDE
jgi:pyrroline-5-carboxylate reductase